jgi:glycosyltransferase involved in cell wall biosynthesis
MEIIFLTLVGITDLNERGIYQDLLRKFVKEGHHITIVTPVERRLNIATNYRTENEVSILQVKTFNIQKSNVIEKGIGTLAIEYQFLAAIKRFLKHKRFDLVLYTTPPITFGKVIDYIKKRDKAYSYLLLKDIFPQNAVDMKMMNKDGLLYRYFRKKEKSLYKISDAIGCMSPANVAFVLKDNPEIPKEKVEENPNSIEPIEHTLSQVEKKSIREKYRLPTDKTVFVYGGNLGKPQGIPFLIEILNANTCQDAHFLIVGNGVEYPRLEGWFLQKRPNNATLLKSLPKADYDRLLASCDVGLIFLSKDFLIPNFPSRLLSYLEMGMPVIAATDVNTDIGDIIEKHQCGIKVISGDTYKMNQAIESLLDREKRLVMGGKSWKLLQTHYLVDFSYKIIIDKMAKNV